MDLSLAEISKRLQELEDLILFIDNTVKFHFTIYWAIASVIIAIFGLTNSFGLRKYVEYRIDRYISSRLDDIVWKASRSKIIYGEKYLYESEFINNQYRFSIGPKDMNVDFTIKDNDIALYPILNEQDKLQYTAEIRNGFLYINFENFSRDKHGGVKWRITYFV